MSELDRLKHINEMYAAQMHRNAKELWLLRKYRDDVNHILFMNDLEQP